MPKQVLDDLRDYKIPAVAQEGHLKVPATGPEVVLFSRSGFSAGLVEAANADSAVTLVELDELVAELDRDTNGS
jgi:hypothetical protein